MKYKCMCSLATVLIISSLTTTSVKAEYTEKGNINVCLTDDSTDGSSNTSIGAGGDWLNTGSANYQNAQKIFESLTKEVGMSGAGASGALAVANRESGFNPKATNSGGGVAGVFQWSGWGNTVNGSRITSEGSIKQGQVDTLTIENEIKLMKYELNGSYKKVKSSVGKSTSPSDAAKNWSQDYEGVSLSDGQSKVDQIVADANSAYITFNASSISANDALLDVSDNATENQATEVSNDSFSCSDEGTSSGSTDIVSVAQQFEGYFTYLQSHGVGLVSAKKEDELKGVSDFNKDGQTDCSGFVWIALKIAGYKVPDNMGWYTKTMEDDARGDHKYLKEISAEDAKAGDIIIVNTGSGSGSEGHTAILAEDNVGGEKVTGNNTKVIQEGGSGGSGGVNEGTIDNSFGYFDGRSPSITFAEPVK